MKRTLIRVALFISCAFLMNVCLATLSAQGTPRTVQDHCVDVVRNKGTDFNDCLDANGGNPNAIYGGSGGSGAGVGGNGGSGIGGNGGSGDGGSGDGGNGGSGSSGRGGSGAGGNGGSGDNAGFRSGPVSTSSFVDHNVTVSGEAHYQPLTYDGIGHVDIIKLGVISATNVWGTVPPGTRVCFVGQSGGGVMFKDKSSTPHPMYWLQHFLVGNDTCVDLPGEGTVVLVRQVGPYADDALSPQPAAARQPICQIKLVDTLFLRAAPVGRIIGLVWLNTEVPVYSVDGHWYEIEFEGLFGYISRYHRKVLSGGC